MPDDSALRSTLAELKAIQDEDLAEKPVRRPSAPIKTESSGGSTGGSLLADLLSETSNEAQREVDEIKAALRSKEHDAAEQRRIEQDKRRQQLDALREQEAQRREQMIRERERREAEAKAAEEARLRPPQPARVAAPIEVAAPPAPKRSAWALPAAVAAVAVLGGGGYAVWTQMQEPPPAAAAPVAEVPVPVAPTPAKIQPPKPVAVAVVQLPREVRDGEDEAGRNERHGLDFPVIAEPAPAKVVHKVHVKHHGEPKKIIKLNTNLGGGIR